MLSFLPLYLQLSPLGHKVIVHAKDNNRHKVIILDSATYPEVSWKWKPTLPSPSVPVSMGRAGLPAIPYPFVLQCQLQAARLSLEMPCFHRPMPLPAFQMAASFLTSSPISLSPLGLHFSVILSPLFLCMSCNVSFRGYGPVVPMAVSDFPVEKCSKQWGSLMPCWARSSPGCQAEVRITLLRFAGCLLPCLDLPHWTDSLIPRAFPQGFTKLPRAVTGLFDTAGKKEKSCRMAEDCSQVVIAFHRCPLWPSIQNCISLLFLPLKWRWQWSCCRKSFAKLNTSHFTPLSVKWCEMWVGAWCNSNILSPILPRFTKGGCGYKKRGWKALIPFLGWQF